MASLGIAVEALEISVDLAQAKQVRRLAVAVALYFRAFDGGYSYCAAQQEMRAALEDMKAKPYPAPDGNVIDMSEGLRLRRKAFKVLPEAKRQQEQE